jgi:hypothetical protein
MEATQADIHRRLQEQVALHRIERVRKVDFYENMVGIQLVHVASRDVRDGFRSYLGSDAELSRGMEWTADFDSLHACDFRNKTPE